MSRLFSKLSGFFKKSFTFFTTSMLDYSDNTISISNQALAGTGTEIKRF